MKNLYYIEKDGGVIPIDDTIEWAKQFETADRKVAVTTIGNYTISTVFLGINHNFWDEGEPLLYETMVFRNDAAEADCDRYPTRAEALKGHTRMVKKWSR